SSEPTHMALDLLIELLLALSMVIIVLDDSQIRTRRLAVVNAITTAIAEAQEFRPMMDVALGELRTLMEAKAAWFRQLDEGHLVLAAQTGSAETIGSTRQTIPIEGSF